MYLIVVDNALAERMRSEGAKEIQSAFGVKAQAYRVFLEEDIKSLSFSIDNEVVDGKCFKTNVLRMTF